jgi:hypothetical protein
MSSTFDRDSADRKESFQWRLTVILGEAGLLLNEALAEPQRKRVEAIHRAGDGADAQAAGVLSPPTDRTARL